jgi:hypothetical protein
MRFFVWIAVWLAGAVIFDGVLQLSGGWLMLGGVLTYVVCNAIDDHLSDPTP